VGAPVRGDVVIIPFPFSDLSATKRRPALVLAALAGDDVILCQITSQARSNGLAIAISGGDFTEGGLNQDSNVRPERLFTADSRITRHVGRLSAAKVQAVISAVVALIRAD
jgi:mRNA interferase MazF